MAEAPAHTPTDEPIIRESTYWLVFAALVVLSIATYLVAFLPLGVGNLIAGVGIAVAKGSLIVVYFMHTRYSNVAIRTVAASALLWLGILLVLTMNDYFTRGWAGH